MRAKKAFSPELAEALSEPVLSLVERVEGEAISNYAIRKPVLSEVLSSAEGRSRRDAIRERLAQRQIPVNL